MGWRIVRRTSCETPTGCSRTRPARPCRPPRTDHTRAIGTPNFWRTTRWASSAVASPSSTHAIASGKGPAECDWRRASSAVPFRRGSVSDRRVIPSSLEYVAPFVDLIFRIATQSKEDAGRGCEARRTVVVADDHVNISQRLRAFARSGLAVRCCPYGRDTSANQRSWAPPNGPAFAWMAARSSCAAASAALTTSGGYPYLT